MKINRAYKFRIYPNKSQQNILNKWFGSCRFLWNRMLDERINVYQKYKHQKDILNSYVYKTERQYKNEYLFLKEVDSKALQSTTKNLLLAFKFFFNGMKKHKKIGFPRFKSRKSKQSYTTYNVTNNLKINFKKKKIKLPKIDSWVKFRDERVFTEPIRHVTVSKTKSGKYFISIIIEREIIHSPKKLISQSRFVSFDMSASNFLISPNYKMKNPRFFRNEEKKIKKLHNQLSRKRKDSSNYCKTKLRLAKKYEKIRNRKLDWTHKTTSMLAMQFDVIILEDLNLQGIQKLNSGISKSITLDFSWDTFISILEYKMFEKGKFLIFVNRWFPSSKLCSVCGWKNKNLLLSDRKWKCQVCETYHDRDINAAKNLRKEGIKQLLNKNIKIYSTVGTTGSHAWEDYVSLL